MTISAIPAATLTALAAEPHARRDSSEARRSIGARVTASLVLGLALTVAARLTIATEIVEPASELAPVAARPLPAPHAVGCMEAPVVPVEPVGMCR